MTTKEQKLNQLKEELDMAMLQAMLAQNIQLSPAAYSLYYGTKKADVNYWVRQVETLENKIKELEEQI